MEYIKTLWYLVPLLLLAGVLDGIAGGGGLIALPAYMLTGMPIHSAYACNKLQSGVGTLTSAVTYGKAGLVDMKITLAALPLTVGMSLLCTRLVMVLPGNVIKIIIGICIPISVVLMFLKRRMSAKTLQRRKADAKTVGLSMLCGALLGTYDALFGPGGGTIAMILFSIFLDYDLRVGCGNGKVIIVASNTTAMVNYLLSGYMIWYIAVPCALANALGSFLGAFLAVKKGEKVVFPAMLLVVITLVVQTALLAFGLS